MNDLDDLRHALESPPGYAPRSLDLAEIIGAGGRLRRRRRLAAGAAGALAVVVLLVGGSQLLGSPAHPVSRTPQAPAAAAPQGDGTLGDVIRTGMAVPGGHGEWVFYAVPVDERALPDTKFGIMLGVRDTAGELHPVIVSNEVKGGDRTTGFHADTAAQNINGRDTPAFGYYAGGAKSIIGTVRDRKVSAHVAPWSEDPSVTVFWFTLADVPAQAQVTGIAAYDRTGKKLPSGSSGFGVG
jgi:hypothetical protein